MAEKAAAARRSTPGYQAMAAAGTVEQLVRRLELATAEAVLDAFEVLREKFGLDGSHELYAYLYELPARYRLYRAAFEAETHAGCVDRTVARIAAEIRANGTPRNERPLGFDAHADRVAALARTAEGPVDRATVEEVLVAAAQADDAARIQRLSNDAREIARRLQAKDQSLPAEQLLATVRLVLTSAADVAREHDGLETA
jgi:hypothetical protein